MTNYKVLPFTEENLKLEGAEVWSKSIVPVKAIHVLPLNVPYAYLIYFENLTFTHRIGIQGHDIDLEIRIPVKQYTVAEVWDNVAETHFSEKKHWKTKVYSDEMNEQIRQFARRIAELAKADQLKLD